MEVGQGEAEPSRRDDERQGALGRAATLLGLLADADRLRLVGALVTGARDLAGAARAAGLEHRSAARALARLEGAGLVERRGGRLVVVEEALRDAARAAAPPPDRDDHGALEPSTAAVLRRFLPGGRLVRLPAQRSTRRVVLDHVARAFEVGVRHPEAEVDAVLRAFAPEDHVTLRRALVDEDFLSRQAGVYWRTGGTVL